MILMKFLFSCTVPVRQISGCIDFILCASPCCIKTGCCQFFLGFCFVSIGKPGRVFPISDLSYPSTQIPFNEKIVLDQGEKFAIIVEIKTPDTVHPVAIEYDAGDGIAQVDLTDGEGYLSHNGSLWEHVEETQKCNLCLKVYTHTEK